MTHLTLDQQVGVKQFGVRELAKTKSRLTIGDKSAKYELCIVCKKSVVDWRTEWHRGRVCRSLWRSQQAYIQVARWHDIPTNDGNLANSWSTILIANI